MADVNEIDLTGETKQAEPVDEQPAADAADDGQPEGQGGAEGQEPHDDAADTLDPGKLKKQLDRANAKIGKLYAQREEARARARMFETATGLPKDPIGDTNQESAADSDTLSVSRADLQRLIAAEAKRLAPQIQQQEADAEHRGRSVSALRLELGESKFRDLTDDLADIFPPEAQLAVLDVEQPRALMEYLTDPANEAEARGIARMDAVRQGIALARLESKLKAKTPKPEPSKAPPPIERVRDAGGRFASEYSPNMSDKEYAEWRKRQIAAR